MEVLDKLMSNPAGQAVLAVVGLAASAFVIALLARIVHGVVGFLRPKAKATPTDLDDKLLDAVDHAADDAERVATDRVGALLGRKSPK